MFSYYGTKKKIAKFYPEPKYDTIIEPFAGSAQYSLFGNNWERKVILFDKYEKVYLTWKYLIECSIEDINRLPDLVEGLNLDTLNISPEEKSLLGFYANPASAVPKKTVTKRGEKSWSRYKKYLIENLYKIKHWKVYNDIYQNIPNEVATYYIDPPYQFGGEYYHSSSSNKLLNYDELKNWSLTRKGEIIVCENSKANWMDFKPLINLKGQLHTTTEVIFYKENK